MYTEEIFIVTFTVLFITNVESQTLCAFDPCIIPNVCNGMTCFLGDDCQQFCACDENSVADDCKNITMTTSTSVTSTVTEKKVFHCKCENSDCLIARENLSFCYCDTGWGGERCDTPCLLNCSENERCFPVPDIPIMSYCKKFTEDEEDTTTSVPVITPEYSNNRTYNVCDASYTLRPISERICNGWPCQYGTCESNGTLVWCNCDPGAIGTMCNRECCKTCLYGSCFYDNERHTELCNCHANYSGPFCERWDPPTTYAPPEEVTWHYWVVGACVLLLLILIALMVVVPYILWRNRVILVMKFVHYFQGYEDDDDRQWDAFISYKSNKADEQFVVKTLFPMLEREMGFKINVHFRDFVPGETIANNIISAVQCSRRTIMIITPSYVTSEFTKFEYQVAQQEMLKRKHRIIPILFDDISECKDAMDPNLKVILNSVTYIEWPKDGDEKKIAKFWKRIELSMPKIKNRSLDIDNDKTNTNGVVKMTKPDDINISLSNKTGKNKTEIPKSNIYNMIDELKLDPEEVYDTLNESEMQSKVIKKSTRQQNGYNNAPQQKF